MLTSTVRSDLEHRQRCDGRAARWREASSTLLLEPWEDQCGTNRSRLNRGQRQHIKDE